MKSKNISIAGILIAITVVMLYLTSIIPINTIAILTLVSAITPICIMRTNVKNSILVYIAAGIISFFLVPVNISILYILFFGLYGIIKFFIEKINNKIVETILKLIFMNLVLFVTIFAFENIVGLDIINQVENIIKNFINTSNINIYKWIGVIIIQPIFIIYDYALTLVITIYIEKIHKRI